MVGNSAAVQANIAVPGMVGTHSSVYIGHPTRNTCTAGVGYQPGEPYAKWGRFACEMPAYSPIGRRHHEKGRVSAGQTSLKSPRRCPRSPRVADLGSNVGQENEYGIDGGSNGEGGADQAGYIRDGGAAQPHKGRDGIDRVGGRGGLRTSYTPSVRGGPAYLEVIMYNSGAEGWACYHVPSRNVFLPLLSYQAAPMVPHHGEFLRSMVNLGRPSTQRGQVCTCL